MHCVQGMIPLYNVTKHIGGLEVVADTNNDQIQADMCERYPDKKH